jgi:hypothetical protein
VSGRLTDAPDARVRVDARSLHRSHSDHAPARDVRLRVPWDLGTTA